MRNGKKATLVGGLIAAVLSAGLSTAQADEGVEFIDTILAKVTSAGSAQPTSFMDAVQRFQDAERVRDEAIVAVSSKEAELNLLKLQLVQRTDFRDFKLEARDGTYEQTQILAAEAYKSGGISMELQSIVDVASGKSPADVAVKNHLLGGVVDNPVADLGEANDELDASQEVRDETMVQLAGGNTALTLLQSELAQAEEAVKVSEDFLSELVKPAPLSGPQTVVGPEGCPKEAPEGTVRVAHSVYDLCKESVEQAATPSAALAIIEAFRGLGAPYACGGAGRLEEFRYDCSSFVSRAYWKGAGLAVANENYAPSTRSMMPWDGYGLSSWFSYVSAENTRPGDLVLQRSCTEEPCTSQHVVMYLARGTQIHTDRCGDVAHIKYFDGFGAENYVVSRRVAPQTSEGTSSVEDFSISSN